MGIYQLNFEGKNKIEVAIMRLQHFEPSEGYYFADSYGKDSCLTRDLLIKSGVKFKSHHNITGIDAPELYQFGKEYHQDTIQHKPSISIFKELATKQGFPTRKSRWCCKLLKEHAGQGRIIVTGIRWQESPAKRGKRRMFEACNKDATTFYLNPIIDWTEKEVWEYIHTYKVPYCSLYDERGEDGKLLFTRLGCVLCPMGTAGQAQIQIKRFPRLAEAWHRAFIRFYDLGWDSVKRWDSAEEMWKYWLSRRGELKVNESQCIMFDN